MNNPKTILLYAPTLHRLRRLSQTVDEAQRFARRGHVEVAGSMLKAQGGLILLRQAIRHDPDSIPTVHQVVKSYQDPVRRMLTLWRDILLAGDAMRTRTADRTVADTMAGMSDSISRLAHRILGR